MFSVQKFYLRFSNSCSSLFVSFSLVALFLTFCCQRTWIAKMHQRQRNVASKTDSFSEGSNQKAAEVTVCLFSATFDLIISGSFQKCEMRFSAASISVVFPGGALGPGGAVDRRLPGRKYKLHLLHIQPGGAAQQVAAGRQQQQLLLTAAAASSLVFFMLFFSALEKVPSRNRGSISVLVQLFKL